MKARHRKQREAGGVAEYEKDKNPPSRTADAEPIISEANKRKRGGKAVKMHGAKPRANGGRTPRKSGGRTGSNMNPLSSAHAGTPPAGHKAKRID